MTQLDTQTATPIPASHLDLVERPLIMSLATTLPDGTPQVTPVWFNYEDGVIYFNTARGRLKDRAIMEKPYVAITIIDPENMYRYLAIRGPVTMSEEGGREHIDLLAKRYTGADKYPGPMSEVRIKFALTPEHVLAAG
jgi:PPOX class probable F420-dependent enzyme